MENNNTKALPRNKFVLWCLGIFAGLTVLKIFKPFAASAQKPKSGKIITMLSEDGKLVQVDISALNGSKRQITDDEIRTWIKR